MNSEADPLNPGSPETSTRKDSATNVPVRVVSDNAVCRAQREGLVNTTRHIGGM
jgi:hypothetical protein